MDHILGSAAVLRPSACVGLIIEGLALIDLVAFLWFCEAGGLGGVLQSYSTVFLESSLSVMSLKLKTPVLKIFPRSRPK